MFLFFSSIWVSSILIPVLIHSRSNKLQFVYLTIISHLACWKAGNFPFQKGKKETAHHYWTLFLKSISRLLYRYIYIFFITEHNPSFTLFLIWSYFFTQSELRCSYKVCSYKKKCSRKQWINKRWRFSQRVWRKFFLTRLISCVIMASLVWFPCFNPVSYDFHCLVSCKQTSNIIIGKILTAIM